jgi:hypothetical protein
MYMYMYMYVQARPVRVACPNSLGTGGFSVTNFTVLATGVVGADTLLVAIDTFTGGGWSEPGAFDSIKLNIGLSSTILNEKQTDSTTHSHLHVVQSFLLLYSSTTSMVGLKRG